MSRKPCRQRALGIGQRELVARWHLDPESLEFGFELLQGLLGCNLRIESIEPRRRLGLTLGNNLQFPADGLRNPFFDRSAGAYGASQLVAASLGQALLDFQLLCQ